MISEEAVQAAHAAICEQNFDDCLEWRGKCVKSVEAAAPHMLRCVADEFAARLPDGTGNGRAYNSHQVARMLRDKAESFDPNPYRGQP